MRKEPFHIFYSLLTLPPRIAATTKTVLGFLLIASHGIQAANASDFYHLEAPCNPIATITCALPYPSDVYAREDSSKPTGKALFFPEGIIREELFAEVPPTLTPQTVFNGSSGYSAATSVVFELEGAPDLNTIATDGGESVVAYNLDTGERTALRVQLNEYARSKRVAAPSQIIEVYPRARWAFQGRYVVFLTNNLKQENHSDFAPSQGFLNAISNDGSPLSEYYEPVIHFIEQQGYARESLISATFFTIRDEEEVTSRVKLLSKTVYEKEHPVRNLKSYYFPIAHVGAVVTGQVLVHNFRDDIGGMRYDPQSATENWINFRLTLPRSAKKEPAPIAIYGHGLSVFKETDFIVSLANASMGVATVSIDHPNHGSRSRADGGYTLSRLDTQYVPMQVGMMIQSPIDTMSLLKAVETSIGEIDALPKKFWSGIISTPEKNGDGVADIDTSRIFYQGTSLGGVLGSTFIALAPDLKGAFLHVTGVGVTNILSNSLVWDTMFSKLEPDIANGAEAMVLKAAMQHEIDYGDAINFVHYFRHPPIGVLPKPIAVISGLNDGIVPNFSTVALAEIAELPHAGEELYPMPGSLKTDELMEGYGVRQFPSIINTGLALDDLAAHGTFLHKEVTTLMKRWAREYVLPRQ